jgi:hypothetical protein
VSTGLGSQADVDAAMALGAAATGGKPESRWFDKALTAAMVPTAYKTLFDPLAATKAFDEVAGIEPASKDATTPFSPLYQASGFPQPSGDYNFTSPSEDDTQGPTDMESSYYKYGDLMSPLAMTGISPALGTTPFANGGVVKFAGGGLANAAALFSARGGNVPHKGSHYVQGAGGGQDDLIDARLADGEYVFDADIVAALGDGSNAEGAKRLDEMREAIRAHKRSAPNNKIPPKAKSPLAYLKKVK